MYLVRAHTHCTPNHSLTQSHAGNGSSICRGCRRGPKDVEGWYITRAARRRVAAVSDRRRSHASSTTTTATTSSFCFSIYGCLVASCAAHALRQVPQQSCIRCLGRVGHRAHACARNGLSPRGCVWASRGWRWRRHRWLLLWQSDKGRKSIARTSHARSVT